MLVWTCWIRIENESITWNNLNFVYGSQEDNDHDKVADCWYVEPWRRNVYEEQRQWDRVIKSSMRNIGQTDRQTRDNSDSWTTQVEWTKPVCSLYFRLTFPSAADVNLSLWHTVQKLRATFHNSRIPFCLTGRLAPGNRPNCDQVHQNNNLPVIMFHGYLSERFLYEFVMRQCSATISSHLSSALDFWQ